MKQTVLTALVSMGLGLHALGGIYFNQTFNSGFQNGGVIPDGSLNGLADTRTVSGASSGWQITGLTVVVNVSGSVNGDLYAYLTHGSGFAVLLNRFGVGSSDPFGASGSGLSSLTFTTSDNSGNVHFLLGYGNNAGGTFAPDGRTIDPLSSASAFDSASTAANFTTFNGLDPNGGWTLFFADTVTGGGSPTLTSWSLDITAVPEPVNVALGVFAGVCGLVLVGRSRPVRNRVHRCWVGINHWLDAV